MQEEEELHWGPHSGSEGCDPETEQCTAMLLCCHGVTIIACDNCHAQTSFILSNERILLISRKSDLYIW